MKKSMSPWQNWKAAIFEINASNGDCYLENMSYKDFKANYKDGEEFLDDNEKADDQSIKLIYNAMNFIGNEYPITNETEFDISSYSKYIENIKKKWLKINEL
jgi:hypothetical protein